MTLLAPPPYQTPQESSFSKGKMLAVVIAATLLLHGGIALFALLYKAKLPPPVKKEVSIRLGPRKKTKVLAEVGKPTKTAGRGAGGSSTGTAPAKQPPGPPSSKTDKPAGLSEKDKAAIAKKTEELMRGMANILKAGGSNPGGDFEGTQAGSSTGAGGGTSLTQAKGTEGHGTAKTNGPLTTSGPRDGVGTGEKTEQAVKAPKSSDDDAPLEAKPGAGTYTKEDVAGAFRSRRQAFNSCFDAALKRNPMLNNETIMVHMKFVRGKMKDVSTSYNSSFQPDEALIGCIKRFTLELPFPPLDSPVEKQTLTYPLTLVRTS